MPINLNLFAFDFIFLVLHLKNGFKYNLMYCYTCKLVYTIHMHNCIHVTYAQWYTRYICTLVYTLHMHTGIHVTYAQWYTRVNKLENTYYKIKFEK